MSRCTSGQRSASCAIASLKSSMLGSNRSSSCSSSSRRRLVHLGNGNDSNCARPCWLHKPRLRRTPSFMAMACNWFITRVRIPTRRCRCHTSCRRSRFSAVGTQTRGKFSSNISFRMCAASIRFAHLLGSNLRRIAYPQLKVQPRQQTLEPARMPGSFHPDAYPDACLLELAIELLGLGAVRQPPLSTLGGFGIYPGDLVHARVIIAALYLACISPIHSLRATGKQNRVSAGGRSQPKGAVVRSLNYRKAPRPTSQTPWRIQGHTSLHSQGRRERSHRVGEPEPNLILNFRS